MFRTAAVGLAVALAATGAHGQGPPRAPSAAPAAALRARAESLWHVIQQQDSEAAAVTARQRLARRFDAGALALLLPGDVGAPTGARMAAGAAAYLRNVVPPGFLAGHVVVAPAATGVDSVAVAEGLAGRMRIPVGVEPRPDSLADGWTVAGEVARAYRETLDSTWRRWLPLDLGASWTLKRDGPATVRELLRGDTRAGAECLEGAAGGCRRWLGLDPEADVFRSRYRPEELRALASGRWFPSQLAAGLAQQCTAGLDQACWRLAALGVLSSIPAGPVPRASLVSYVRAHAAPLALQHALEDRTGGVGQRLARAAGVDEDSLVAGWRIWLLRGGGQPRVTASLREAGLTALFTAVLLAAAARSGRWR